MKVDLDKLAGRKGGKQSRRLAKYWLEQIKKVDAEQKRWLKRGLAIEKRYRDERNRSEEEGQRRANYLWANTQIMLPAIYGKCPQPIVNRRFNDKDPVGRAAASILERSLHNDLETDNFHESVGSAVLDFLLPGRGVCWVRYEPEIGESVSIPVESQNDLRDDEGDIEPDRSSKESNDRDGFDADEDAGDLDDEEEKLEDTGDRLIQESAPVDYVAWRDFYLFPAKARRFREVTAGAKLCFMSKDEMVERWGEDVAEEIPLQKEDKDKREANEGKATTDKNDDKAHVYEIWDKQKLEVVWVADGYDYILDRKDDPLKLTKFFPFPCPLTANATNGTVVPVPMYIQYQDQARQIDELTQRISQVTKAIKAAGVYNAAAEAIGRLLDESVENELIPVDNWQAFADKKGIEGQLSMLPLKELIEVLAQLVEIKKSTVEEMYTLTGITDVIRGVTTDARETLGKGKLNNNNGKSRLRQTQDEVARFCREVVQIKAEILSKHFSSRSLIESSGALYEEGLGLADVMALNGGDAGQDMQPPMGGAPGAASGLGGPMHPPQAQLAPPAGGAPGAPPMGGQNVVPFRPPVAAPQGAPGAFPSPMTPGAPPSGQPGPPMHPPMAGAPGQPPGAPPPQMTPYGPLSDQGKVLQALQKIKAALQLLRDDHKRGFRIDIEVDSTIVADEEADKAQRTEFVGMVTKFMMTAGEMSMQQPDVMPFMGKMLQFAVRGFRVGRDLETALDEFIEKADEKAKAMGGKPPPNPEMIKAQATAKAQQVKTQGELQKQKMDSQQKQQQFQMEMQIEDRRAQAEEQSNQADIYIKKLEVQIEMMKAQIEQIADQMKLKMKGAEMQMDHQHAQQQHGLDMQMAEQSHGMEMETMQHEHQARREQAAQPQPQQQGAA
jgi:hypothetical protein